MNTKKIIINFISNHKNHVAYSAFFRLYREKLLLWIRSFIFDKKNLTDSEDILQSVLIDLWKYDSFKNFKIETDETFFVNSFEKYLKNIIVKRGVSKYLSKKQYNLDIDYCGDYNFADSPDDNLTFSLDAKKMKSILEMSEDVNKLSMRVKDIKENLEDFLNTTCLKGNSRRDFEIFVKNKIDGYSVTYLASEYKITTNAVSMKIYRIGKLLKEFLKK